MARRDLLRVMTHPAVLAGHPHVDAADWVRWTERLGIVHGADARRAPRHLPRGAPRPLPLGSGRAAARARRVHGRRARASAARRGSRELEVAPEELRPDQQASAATYALLVRSLCADAAWLADATRRRSPSGPTCSRASSTSTSRRATTRPRATSSACARCSPASRTLDLDGRALGFREAREHAARRLGAARANRGEPLAAGVMVAPLAAMRAVPFRVVFVAGLDEGAFPAGDQPSPLDLRREPRAGDVVAARSRPRRVPRGAARARATRCTCRTSRSRRRAASRSGRRRSCSSSPTRSRRTSARRRAARRSRGSPCATRCTGSAVAAGAASGCRRSRASAGRCAVRDALRAHLRAARPRRSPTRTAMLALLAHPAQAAAARRARRSSTRPRGAARPPPSRPLDDREPARVPRAPDPGVGAGRARARRAARRRGDRAQRRAVPPRPRRRARVLLREVFAAQLRDPERRDRGALRRGRRATSQLRGQFPVGVFAEAARALDLRAARARGATQLGPIAVGARDAARLRPRVVAGRGAAARRSSSSCPAAGPFGSSARPSCSLRGGDRYTSVIPLLGELEKRSRVSPARRVRSRRARRGRPRDRRPRAPADRSRTATSREVEHAPWTQRRRARATSRRWSPSCSTSRTATCCRSRRSSRRSPAASRRPQLRRPDGRRSATGRSSAPTASSAPPDADRDRAAPARARSSSACTATTASEVES